MDKQREETFFVRSGNLSHKTMAASYEAAVLIALDSGDEGTELGSIIACARTRQDGRNRRWRYFHTIEFLKAHGLLETGDVR